MSNYMPYKVFSENQGDGEAVRGKLPRVVSRERSCDSFGEYRLNRALVGATPLGSGCSDSLAVGRFSHRIGELGVD